MGSASKPSQESQSPAKHSLAATQPINSQPDAAGYAADASSGGGFCINAAKPDLLAQIQAVGQCATLVVTDADHAVALRKEQESDKLSLPHEQPQALKSGELPWIPDPLLSCSKIPLDMLKWAMFCSVSARAGLGQDLSSTGPIVLDVVVPITCTALQANMHCIPANQLI